MLSEVIEPTQGYSATFRACYSLSLSLARSALSDTILSVSLLITLILGAFNLMIGRTVS